MLAASASERCARDRKKNARAVAIASVAAAAAKSSKKQSIDRAGSLGGRRTGQDDDRGREG